MLINKELKEKIRSVFFAVITVLMVWLFPVQAVVLSMATGLSGFVGHIVTLKTAPEEQEETFLAIVYCGFMITLFILILWMHATETYPQLTR